MRLLARLLTFLFFLGAWALGQAIIGLDPSNTLLHVQPGQTITKTVSVYNPDAGDDTYQVNAYLSDFTYDPIGQVSYSNPSTVPESAAKWITVSPSSVILKGQDRQNVQFTLTIPVDAKPGSYWSMLMFEAEPPDVKPGTLAAFRMRVAHTVWLYVDPVTAQGQVSGIFDQQPKDENSPMHIGVQYNNTGTATTGIQGHLEIRNAQGDLVQTVPLNLLVSLPGRTVLLQTDVNGLKKGQYFVLAVLNNGSQSQDIVGQYTMNVPFDLKGQAAASTGQAP